MSSVFDELTIEDSKILKELDNAKGNYQKIIEVFALRITLYKDYAKKTHDPILRAIINTKKSLIISDVGLLSTQNNLQKDIAKIISRLDALEEKVYRNQDRKPR
jgi:hypothetical protein